MKIKKILFLGLLILISSCSKKESKSEVQNLKKWIELKAIDSMPKPLNEELFKIFGKNFKMADFNENFNATDFLTDSLPTRRISLLVRNKNHWRMVYEQGGFAKYYVLIDSYIDKDSITSLKISETQLKIVDNANIDSLINKKQLKFKKIK